MAAENVSRHVHHNLTASFLAALYVIAWITFLKFVLAKWRVPGISELVMAV